MPSTRIETRAGWIGERHAELIAAVHRAIVEGILIPESDRHVRILEYPPEAFAAARHNGPNYTIVEISMFSGRTPDAKRRLYQALVREFAAFGVGPTDLTINLHDVPRENWGIRGQSAADIDLGFKVEV